ncbi:hypothetical protein SAMN06297251_105150 [Fulvimarina manganoxydans]|uniref:DUF4345 domain-containing protein n=1 Tax=Fulvimarina manganoxydans TaxID=937218 RepID=A0A1W2AX64_9HYPH|nr:DUF4345 domain-containing protein [Fulvimarina manganoxydans]SMC65337.1 hypothetical protein SAMN06297251_105150 [Fulvimarina manganoxydans]
MPFPLPIDLVGWLSFAAACLTLLFGLIALFAPRIIFAVLRLQPRQSYPQAIGEARSTLAGFWLGVGLVGIFLFDQPFVQFCLGAGWLMSAFGRLVSILSDQGANLANWLFFLLMLALAGAALLPAFGLIG